MKKIKLKERDITKIIGMALQEQDLSKIKWYRGGEHESWFQYHNTFSGCRAGFTTLLKKLTEFFGEEVTKEVNQLIVSFKRGMIQVKNQRKDKLTNDDKDVIVQYLKPQFERIGVEWTDEDEKSLAEAGSSEKRRLEQKKELVETALWEWIMVERLAGNAGASVYRLCANEYSDAKRKYENQQDDNRNYDQLSADYTQISGDKAELEKKLQAANNAIIQKDILIAKLKKQLANQESPIIRQKKTRK
jgi:hypothetical protein